MTRAPQIKAKFDTAKCNFTVTIKKTNLATTSGSTTFGMLIDISFIPELDYFEIVKVNLR